MDYIFNDVKLKFDADTEYSVDGGNTWTNLPANTEHVVQGSEIATSKKVMIRSTAQDITLNKTDLEWDSKEFSTINIKNGEALTDLTNVLRELNIKDTLQLINIPRVTSLQGFCENSTVNNVILGQIPSTCTNLRFIGYRANINYFNGLKVSHEVKKQLIFYQANVNYLGDIAMKSPALTSSTTDVSGREFCEANIDSMGNLSLSSENTYNNHVHYNSVCKGLNTSYILSGNIEIKGSNSYSMNFNNMSTFFTGLNFKFINTESQNNNDTLQYNPNLIYPFRSAYKNNGNFSMFLYNTPNLTSDIPSQILSDFKSSSTTNKIIELTKYLPDFIVLHNDVTPTLQGKVSVGAKGLHYYMYEGTDIVVQTVNKNVQPLKLMTALKSESINYTSSVVYICRNGTYGVYDGSTVTIFNPNDVQVGTITDDSIVGANFNQVGTVLLVAKGGSVDTSSTDDQTISSSVVKYDTITGNSLYTYNLADKINTEIVGVYQPNESSNMHVVYNRYEVVDGAMTLVESYVDTYFYGALIKTTVLPNIVDYMCNHYAEDNEFNCINRTEGRVIRCFGC